MPLPPEILASRLKNEIEACQRQMRHHIEVSDPYLRDFPVTVKVVLLRTPGPVLIDGRLATRYTHTLQVIVMDNYPYEKPIVKWKTPVFHPNIMEPEDGGYVCTKLLERWDFRSTLLTFIEGLEILLGNPNPVNPFRSESCRRAAEYFSAHRYLPPQLLSAGSGPHVLGDGVG